jgi:hypothetical protein
MNVNEKILDTIFKQARKDLFYPPIVKIGLADVETSEIDFSGRRYRIFLGRKIVTHLSQNAILGILHHELNHWARHPYDVKTIIMENHFLGDISHKNDIRNIYDDVIVNLDLIINKGLIEVAEAYRELPPVGKVDRLLRAFYKEITGIDFGEVSLDLEVKERLNNLFEIEFLNTSRQGIKANIKKFAAIIGDLVYEEIYLPFSVFSLKNFTPEEIKKAMGHLAEELDPIEYRSIAGDILKELKKTITISPGKKSLLQALERPDVSWYRTRARRYSVFIEALSKNGSLYPYEIKDFDLDDNMDTFSAIESYGKVLPGLAKRYSLEGFEGHEEVSIPDVIIMMDSSGSMRYPDGEVSHAVLGAFSIARNYLEHGSKVGIINFSDTNLTLDPTRDDNKVYEMLKIFQGGGTTLHLDDLNQYLSSLTAKNRKTMDYILITDAGIDNIINLVEYLSKLKGRLTIIWIKSDIKENEKFERNYKLLKEGLPSSVTFVEIEDEKDIPCIAVGKSFGAYARH